MNKDWRLIIEHFDSILSAQCVNNEVFVTGIKDGKDETIIKEFSSMEIAEEVSLKVSYFIGI